MFRADSRLPARLVLELILELPDDGAFIASLKAATPPDATPSPGATAVRSRRRFRGWTADRGYLADIRDVLVGKASSRPWGGVADRRVVEELPI